MGWSGRGLRGIAATPLRSLDQLVGGADRRRVILPLAVVLGLQAADMSAIGASAGPLEAGLHIDEARIGLLLSVGVLVGAVMTLPAGALVDRVRRTRLLGWAVMSWGAAMALSAAATGFSWMLWSRVGLGAVMAVAGPATASLIGDYVPPHERGRVYGYVLCGELLGAAFGLLVAGELAAISWRAAFLVLILPGIFACGLVLRLPEPPRGAYRRRPDSGRPAADAPPISMVSAARYVLRIPTNLVLIVASMLGYFFIAALRGFAVQFTSQHYHLPHSVAILIALVVGLGALGGLFFGGRLADSLQHRGHRAARITVPGASAALCVALFFPALATRNVWLALPLLVAAVACLGAVTAPLDAARLDVVVPEVWGRAEAIRTVLRDGGEAGGPLLFGWLAASVFTGPARLAYAFMVSLAALLAQAALLTLVARRTYPRDKARAEEA